MSIPSTLADRLENVRAVVLDMDGVVIDSEPLHERAQEHVFARFGLNVPRSELITFKGRTERDVFQDVLSRYGNGHHDLDTVVAAKHRAYQELLADVQSIDGVLPFVRRLQGRFPLALTTSAIAENQRFVFDRLDLDGMFDVIVTAADVVNSKPHPDPYLITVKRLGIDPDQALVVEDSRLGIRSAKAAGCTVVGLVGTFTRRELEEELPHLVIDRFSELTDLPALAA